MRENNQTFVPKDNDEMCNHYFVGERSLAAQITRTMLPHSTPEEREDVVQEAVIRAIRHNIVAKFDPSKGNFGGLVYVSVRSAVGNHLSKKSRNPVTGLNGGSLVETDEEFELGQYQLGRVFSVDPRLDEQVDTNDTLQRILEYCRTKFKNPAHKRDQSLLPLVEYLAQGFEPKECAQKLGVTPSTIINWMRYLKEVAS